MKELRYQNEAIEKLLRYSEECLKDKDDLSLVVFQAPTGSGKTIMLAEFLSQIVKKCQDLAFFWISLNLLHKQSKKKLEGCFEQNKALDCISIDEIQNNEIEENQILFMNWESLNKRGKNLFMTENERDKNLNKVIRDTKSSGKTVILIIDESHRSARTEKAREIRNIIAPSLTIESSATPKESASDHKVKVKIIDVIAEEMIKSEIRINPQLEVESNEDMLSEAIRKREYLKRQYEKINSNVNPLLLIQIPNKKQSDAQAPEDVILEFVRREANKEPSLWLSERKEGLEDLVKNDSSVDILIFKEAIALGWDCPRASILFLQREWNAENYEFNTQTLGRIMRMPEQKHYENSDLNIGYVYSATNNFSIVEDLAKNYVSKQVMERNNGVYRDIHLPSQHIRRKREQTRLSGEFRKCLFEAEEAEHFGSRIDTKTMRHTKHIALDGSTRNIDKPQDVRFEKHKLIEKIEPELCSEYTQFLSEQTSPFEKSRSTETIKSSVRSFFKEKFGISDENEIANIALKPHNKDVLVALIEAAKEIYKDQPKRKDEKNPNDNWQVPEAVSIFDNYEVKEEFKKSILQPFAIKTDEHGKWFLSQPEKIFIEKLETVGDCVLWWFKNGVRESRFFGISYDRGGQLYGFYPDFIIKTRKDILIVEIKSDGDVTDENLAKMKAGREYKENYKGEENLYFWMISPEDYDKFFNALKQDKLSDFSSNYEEKIIMALSSTGTRGNLTMPHSMASISEKSDNPEW